MSYRGDLFSGCTISGSFTTVDTSGKPEVLGGNPCAQLIAYVHKPGDATGFTCSTAGITLAFNCNGRAGWNAWSVDTNTAPATYACGRDVSLVLNGGTVGTSGGICTSGYVVASFSLRARAGLQPTIHGRTLDVTATGAAGIDWGNVENPTTAVGLDCTTLFRITSVLNAVTAGTVNDKTGYALSAAGNACITSAPIFEPANVPGWPMSMCTLLGWLGALASNCVTQTASRQSVCNRAASSTIASANITCTTTIVHRGSFT